MVACVVFCFVRIEKKNTAITILVICVCTIFASMHLYMKFFFRLFVLFIRQLIALTVPTVMINVRIPFGIYANAKINVILFHTAHTEES